MYDPQAYLYTLAFFGKSTQQIAREVGGIGEILQGRSTKYRNKKEE